MSYYGPMDNLLAERDKLRAEVERLRAKADAGNAFLIGARIVELSKPAAEESEPVKDDGYTFKVYGVTFTADPKAPRSAVHQALECIKHAFASVTAMVETKPEEPVKLDGLVIGGVKVTKDNLKCFFDAPEEPDWTVTLAAQAKVAYVNSAEPADELKVRLLSLVVEGLCNLGREVRRGGAK